MYFRLISALFTVLMAPVLWALDTTKLQVGDIIFQKSQSQQSAAIAEATGSTWTHVGILVKKPKDNNWYVAEAAQSSMNVVTLTNFISRSRNQEVVVKRIDANLVDMSKSQNQNSLVNAVYSFAGKKYDLFFEWNDDAIYCSELVWKSYKKAFGVLTGVVQHIRELNITGPAVKQLMEYRQKMKGSPINLDEPIVTPYSLFVDASLSVITSN
jgi:hypothetical protein